MTRPLRIEFPGALYHVTSRGNQREAIYLSDSDRDIWLEVFAEVCRRFNWSCHAYCLMDNHYHLLVETPEGNLSPGMRQLNGVYTQRFNRLHGRIGHVFQGRYKSILVDKNSYLLELARYIVLNPVRAAMVRSAKDWPWSSYRATAGWITAPAWLQTDWILSAFAKRHKTACERFRKFVSEGKGQPSPWEHLRNQVFLGNEQFVAEMQALIDPEKSLAEIPQGQKRKMAKPLGDYQMQCRSRDDAIYQAYRSGGYKMAELSEYFGLHYSSISKIIRRLENSRIKTLLYP
ncbi:REP-associated tyrosine transposase [Sedimenticola hydrogenitrophicus]|uniref:REP-associated tyrosine transposase n=1 Tax=Sedimenticola hydrogenitrophicus TaxID=2967975 RepID=UPI0023B0BA47|nr:transposase [Sedimenticola hydrogenitrophicus]